MISISRSRPSAAEWPVDCCICLLHHWVLQLDNTVALTALDSSEPSKATKQQAQSINASSENVVHAKRHPPPSRHTIDKPPPRAVENVVQAKRQPPPSKATKQQAQSKPSDSFLLLRAVDKPPTRAVENVVQAKRQPPPSKATKQQAQSINASSEPSYKPSDSLLLRAVVQSTSLLQEPSKSSYKPSDSLLRAVVQSTSQLSAARRLVHAFDGSAEEAC
jgi:hypothetical protein